LSGKRGKTEKKLYANKNFLKFAKSNANPAPMSEFTTLMVSLENLKQL